MPTDQKVGGSSPSERAQVTGPYPLREGPFWCRWEPCWEPRRPIRAPLHGGLRGLTQRPLPRAPGACEEDGQDKQPV